MKKRSDLPTAEVMTVEQVADYLQLNKLTVYKYVRDGRLPASKLGKSYRIRRSDVELFLDNAKQGTRRSPAAARRAARRPAQGAKAAAAARRAEEVYVGPRRRETDALQTPSINPMDWVIRGLH